jgi:vancomycin aglycone glucosyltransferase
MRVLLSTVGTRGDAQPVLALALEVRELGHEVRLCVPPNFREWFGGLGFEVTPVGIEMRLPKPGAAPPALEQPRQLRAAAPDLITDQFDSIGPAAKGCDLILGAGAHQYAARSIAEVNDIPYVNALYAPVTLPSPDHAPPPAPGQSWRAGLAPDEVRRRWAQSFRAWNDRALARVNENRARLGLAPIDDMQSHIFTEQPWLAADPTLGPAPDTPGRRVVQTGAWLLPDPSPLAPELEAFLADGEPPVYLGFGSMPAPESTGRTLIDAARAAGRRAILAQGWAELGLVEADHPAADCLSIGDVNQQALFPRVAAVVHHGGAGTTTAAGRAGVPQVIAPMFNDQFYWAQRIRDLGIGSSAPSGPLTAESLAAALGEALEPTVAERARAVASAVTPDGASVAARRLTGDA